MYPNFHVANTAICSDDVIWYQSLCSDNRTVEVHAHANQDPFKAFTNYFKQIVKHLNSMIKKILLHIEHFAFKINKYMLHYYNIQSDSD